VRIARLALFALLAAAPLVFGACASLRGAEPKIPPRPLVRPDLPPEYDFLVAQDLELDGKLPEALAAYQRALAKDPDSPELLRKVAELMARQGMLDEALVNARRAYELDPSDSEGRLFLGTLYRLRRELEPAREILTDESGQPVDLDAALLLYGIYTDAGEHEEALATAQWMVRTDPTNLRGYFALSRALERLDRNAEAEQALRRALEVQPDSLAVYGALARSRRQRGDHDGEIAIYREVLASNPHHHPTLVALADAQLGLGRYEKARATLLDIVRLYPGDLRSLVRLGYVELELGLYSEASARFEQAHEANPSQPEVAYLLGLVRRRTGDDDGAIQVFQSIAEDDERYSDARAQIASIYERRGDYAAALEEVERARRASPSRQLDLYAASLQAKAGDFDGAVSFLNGLIAQDPGDEELVYNLGVVYGEAGHTDEALRYMQQVLAANPEHAGALNYVGYSWAERGLNLDQAEQMISRALQQRPDDGYITDSLGWVYYMRARPLLQAGDFEKGRALLERAIVELERAAQLTGGDPVVNEHLGDAYLLLDDRERALKLYEEALAADPRKDDHAELREKLERLRQELAPR
jgi:tetratricopeptide (TPR) repeat protein